jgi:hypothetical protein
MKAGPGLGSGCAEVSRKDAKTQRELGARRGDHEILERDENRTGLGSGCAEVSRKDAKSQRREDREGCMG